MKRNFSPSLGVCAGLLAFGLLGCPDEGAGKYRLGHDDPALTVTKADLDQVKDVLSRQEALDREAGIRSEPPAIAADAADPHAGLGDIASAEAPAQPPPSAAAPAAPGPEGSIEIGMLRGVPPKDWIIEAPSSSMRLAQMRLPRAEGDGDDGELAVFHFGQEAGGIEQNLQRWFGQFSQPDGRDSRDVAAIEELAAMNGMRMVLIDLPGTMEPSNMPGQAPTPKREGWRMLAAIVMSTQGPVFLKGTGPDKTMASQKEGMKAFLLSLTEPGAAPRAMAQAEAAPPSAPAAPPAASQPAAPAAEGGASGGPIDLKLVSGTLPEGWRSIPPSSSMRLAEMRIAKAEGDPEDGEIAVFYFGPDAGGVDANINRWIGQFSQPDGSDPKAAAKTEKFSANGMEMTLLDLSGTMEPSTMPGRPATARKENWRMLAAIVMTPEGPLFIKATGPAKTMAANRDKMKAFISGLAKK